MQYIVKPFIRKIYGVIRARSVLIWKRLPFSVLVEYLGMNMVSVLIASDKHPVKRNGYGLEMDNDKRNAV